MAKIQFLGATRTVTGSCYLVEAGNSRILVDCGLFQGTKEIRNNNYDAFSFDPASISFLLLTHAHIDHSGLIPELYRRGFRGRILATAPTCDLCQVLLPDSAHVQEMEVERKNRKRRRAGRAMLQPIYTVEEAYRCLHLFQPVDYRRVIGVTPEIKACFYDAGHILGSATIKLWIRDTDGSERTVVFSGDIGRTAQALVNEPEVPSDTDYLVMETTYGARRHNPNRDILPRLAKIIAETHRRGGNVIIPAFAVERSQDILFALGELLSRGEIEPNSIYLDSPLAVAATEIFCRHIKYMDEETQAAAVDRGTCPFLLPGLNLTRSAEESMAVNQVQRGAIIVAASGMCDAGRIKHHLKHNLWRPECTVILVGYMAEGTLGRRLADGAKDVTIHGEQVAVKAAIEKMDDFSAHADQIGLLAWVNRFFDLPAQIFLTHGEEEAMDVFSRLLAEEFKGVKITIPRMLDSFELPVPAEKPVSLEEDEDLAAAQVAAGSSTLQDVQTEFDALKDELEAWLKQNIEVSNYSSIRQQLNRMRQKLKAE